MRDFIFSLLFVHFAVSADPYTCQKSVTINPPDDISNPWLYPNGYDGKGDAPRFGQNQNCTWKFNVPKGMYAVMTITASTNQTTLNFINSDGVIRWMSVNVYQDPYYALDPGFSVNLVAASSGTLGMEVIWSKVGAFNPKEHQVVPNDTPWVISSGAFDSGLVISSASQVSLVSLPPPPSFSQLKPYMRNTVVFDGPTINDKLIGNLWEIWDSGNQVVSSGKSLTLFALVPNIQLNDYILLQDYDNVKQFSNYKGASCYSINTCVVTIQAGTTPGAAVRMSATPHYLESIVLAPALNLTVYTGAIQNSDQLITYQHSRKYPSLPQKFTGLFTTYVVNDGVAVINISPDGTDPNWANVTYGRKGFLVSKNHGSSSIDQDISETFTGTLVSSFKVSVRDSGLVGAAVMQITVTDGKNTVFDEKYTSNHLPTAPISADGTSLSIKYQTNGAETNGAYVDFEFRNPGSLSSTSTTAPPVVPTETTTNSFSNTTTTKLVPIVNHSTTSTVSLSSTSTASIVVAGTSTGGAPKDSTTETVPILNHTSTRIVSFSSTSTDSGVTTETTTDIVPNVSSTKSIPVENFSTSRIIPSQPTTARVETTTSSSPSGYPILVLISGLLFHRVV